MVSTLRPQFAASRFSAVVFPLAARSRHSYTSWVLALRTRSTTLKKLFHLLFVLLGCLHLAGGPYSLLQGYAWVNMLVTYSQDDGLVQAAKDTFSGEKPCHLCTRIASARESSPAGQEPLAPPPVSSVKLLQDMIATEPLALKLPRSTDLIPPAFPATRGFPGHDRDAPPIPPPCRAA